MGAFRAVTKLLTGLFADAMPLAKEPSEIAGMCPLRPVRHSVIGLASEIPSRTRRPEWAVVRAFRSCSRFVQRVVDADIRLGGP